MIQASSQALSVTQRGQLTVVLRSVTPDSLAFAPQRPLTCGFAARHLRMLSNGQPASARWVRGYPDHGRFSSIMTRCDWYSGERKGWPQVEVFLGVEDGKTSAGVRGGRFHWIKSLQEPAGRWLPGCHLRFFGPPRQRAESCLAETVAV